MKKLIVKNPEEVEFSSEISLGDIKKAEILFNISRQQKGLMVDSVSHLNVAQRAKLLKVKSFLERIARSILRMPGPCCRDRDIERRMLPC